MLRRKSHAGAVGRGSHEFSMPTSTSSSFFTLKSLPRTPPIVEGACARGVVALARAQASSEAHARTRERCPEQQRLKARASLSLAGVAAGGAAPGVGEAFRRRGGRVDGLHVMSTRQERQALQWCSPRRGRLGGFGRLVVESVHRGSHLTAAGQKSPLWQVSVAALWPLLQRSGRRPGR